MSQGKRVAHSQTAVQVIGQRSYRASRSSNRLIAAAAIIVVILITATCSVFFDLQSFSALQDLKSYGTTTDVIISSPTAEQLAQLEENEQVRKPLYVSYKLGRLIGNTGQSGLSIDLYAVDNWDTWGSPLVDDLQGHYPIKANEVMMSTWLLKRFGIDPAVGTEITLSVGWDDCDAVQDETFYLSGFYTDTSYIDTASRQQVFLSTAVLSQHDLPAAIVGFSFSSGGIQKDLDRISEQLGLTEQQSVTVLSGRQMSLRDMALALAVILFFMVDGFLIIYNINSISVTKDVQFYGLLKTIGISPRAPWLVVSNKVIDQYRPDAIIYSIKIDSDPDYAQSILNQVKSLTEHIPAISRTSKIELAESLAEAKSSLSKLSAFLTIVLFSIGILNFINTMSANILNRQKEFASMEAVGATRRQVRGMIVWEGLWYFASTMALALTVGSAADVLLFAAIQNTLGFGAFHYPAVPFALYILLALALCGMIPAVIYQKAGTGSIVQRLRENWI